MSRDQIGLHLESSNINSPEFSLPSHLPLTLEKQTRERDDRYIERKLRESCGTNDEAHFQEASHREQPRPESGQRISGHRVPHVRRRSPSKLRPISVEPADFVSVCGRTCGVHSGGVGGESARLLLVGGGVPGSDSPSAQRIGAGLSRRSGEGSDPRHNVAEQFCSREGRRRGFAVTAVLGELIGLNLM